MSTSRRPKKAAHHEEEHGENHERWLLTYADMITLLMVLFIVLFAVSVVDKQKFAELADGLSHQFGASTKILPDGTGVLDGGKTANDDQGQLDNNPESPVVPITQAEATAQQQATQQQLAEEAAAKQETDTLTTAEKAIQAALAAKGLSQSAQLTIDSRGLVVSIVSDQVLFATGQADLEPAGDQVLDAIGPTLAKLPNNISIEGHTDNVPISSGAFPSNWELSAVRATTVLRYLVTNDGLQDDRMSATGYADTKPVAPNDTDTHRAQNRRVDVVVLAMLAPTSAGSSAAPSSAVPSGTAVPNLPSSTAPTPPASAPASAVPSGTSNASGSSPRAPGISPDPLDLADGGALQ